MKDDRQEEYSLVQWRMDMAETLSKKATGRIGGRYWNFYLRGSKIFTDCGRKSIDEIIEITEGGTFDGAPIVVKGKKQFIEAVTKWGNDYIEMLKKIIKKHIQW